MEFSLNQGQATQNQGSHYKREDNFLMQFHRSLILAEIRNYGVS